MAQKAEPSIARHHNLKYLKIRLARHCLFSNKLRLYVIADRRADLQMYLCPHGKRGQKEGSNVYECLRIIVHK